MKPILRVVLSSSRDISLGNRLPPSSWLGATDPQYPQRSLSHPPRDPKVEIIVQRTLPVDYVEVPLLHFQRPPHYTTRRRLIDILQPLKCIMIRNHYEVISLLIWSQPFGRVYFPSDFFTISGALLQWGANL